MSDDTLYSILNGDCREMLKTLDPESVQTCVTSPPYWNLRDYNVKGQIGLESSLDDYIAELVSVFQEVRRVLRKDGTLWLNLGSSYSSGGRSSYDPALVSRTSGVRNSAATVGTHRPPMPDGFKPKDLIPTPWLIGLALQQDGWYLRSDIIWHKPNPMPSSVTDRPTLAHEYVLLLSKSPQYFYDADAIREPSTSVTTKMPDGWDTGAGGHGSFHREGREKGRRTDKQRGHGRQHAGFNDRWDAMSKEEQGANGRNKRSVWTVATFPYPDSHFATFPPALIEPCILAGTSEYGCCSQCGASWRRVTSRPTPPDVDPSSLDRFGTGDAGVHRKVGGQYQKWLDANPTQTIGWEPTCKHGADVAACVVLDPFAGSGTVGHVATKHRRRSVLIELNPEYCQLITKRLRVQQTLPLESIA